MQLQRARTFSGYSNVNVQSADVREEMKAAQSFNLGNNRSDSYGQGKNVPPGLGSLATPQVCALAIATSVPPNGG